MYSVNISIRSTDAAASQEFEQAAAQFVEELKNVSGLDVQAPTQKVANSKGELPLLTDIIAYGRSIGAFSAIYTLFKDLTARYFKAEVELKFPDGSSMMLKGLSLQEAEQKMKEHLEKYSPSPIVRAKG
ncbi:hypothetical protein U14_05981 [Candidatus Moduliflexus flocculans]|uniref:Uncharacterized protein n=1 Tax=Candidatus Moduliflexus flocculans TaxID=1499966 RepID=A0A081BTG2_9BACT|nr:hypothetical protein U14_05981 [Candidatus Moduliflexus flocculans]